MPPATRLLARLRPAVTQLQVAPEAQDGRPVREDPAPVAGVAVQAARPVDRTEVPAGRVVAVPLRTVVATALAWCRPVQVAGAPSVGPAGPMAPVDLVVPVALEDGAQVVLVVPGYRPRARWALAARRVRAALEDLVVPAVRAVLVAEALADLVVPVVRVDPAGPAGSARSAGVARARSRPRPAGAATCRPGRSWSASSRSASSASAP